MCTNMLCVNAPVHQFAFLDVCTYSVTQPCLGREQRGPRKQLQCGRELFYRRRPCSARALASALACAKIIIANGSKRRRAAASRSPMRGVCRLTSASQVAHVGGPTCACPAWSDGAAEGLEHEALSCGSTRPTGKGRRRLWPCGTACPVLPSSCSRMLSSLRTVWAAGVVGSSSGSCTWLSASSGSSCSTSTSSSDMNCAKLSPDMLEAGSFQA